MKTLLSLLLELDGLKSVYRKSYVAGGVRQENSAEHSWHLAASLIAVQTRLPEGFDLHRAIRMALVHDVCEVGADDVCAYQPDERKAVREKTYLSSLQDVYPEFGAEAMALWLEYEGQKTIESKWVKVVDKLLPFVLNLSSRGKTWREQGITKQMVVEHHTFVRAVDPELHDWILGEVDRAVATGWLADR